MTGEDFESRIADLRQRSALKRDAKPTDGDSSGSGQNSAALSKAYQIGVELVVAVGVCTAGGWFIDDWLGTRPVAMILLFFLGAAAGIRNVVRSATEIGAVPSTSPGAAGTREAADLDKTGDRSPRTEL